MDDMRRLYVEFAVETGRLDDAVNALSRLGWEVRVLDEHYRLDETEADETAVHVEAILPDEDPTLLEATADELEGADVVFRQLRHGIRELTEGWLSVRVDGAEQVPALRIDSMGNHIGQLRALAAGLGMDVTRFTIDPEDDPYSGEHWNDS